MEEHHVQVNGYKGLEIWQYLELELGMYRYGWAHGCAAFQAFQNGFPADEPRVWSKRKAFFDAFVVLLQSRNNVTKIWSLGWVGCPTALYQMCKCWLTTCWQWRPLILPWKQKLNYIELVCCPKFWGHRLHFRVKNIVSNKRIIFNGNNNGIRYVYPAESFPFIVRSVICILSSITYLLLPQLSPIIWAWEPYQW